MTLSFQGANWSAAETCRGGRGRIGLIYIFALIIYGFLFYRQALIFSFPIDTWVFYIFANPILPIFGMQRAAPPDEFSIFREARVLFFSPGLLSGMAISFLHVRSVKEVWKTLFPPMFVSVSAIFILTLFHAWASPIAIFLIIPIIVSFPYALLGGLFACTFMRLCRRFGRLGVATLVSALALVPRPAWCWEPKSSHPNLDRLGSAILQQSAPNTYSEFDYYGGRLRTGGTEEDEGVPYIRGQWHYYNPLTNAGLVLRTVETPDGLSPFSSAITTSREQWRLAFAAYIMGHKSEAYYRLGRVAHLVTQDLFQPQHVHDDPHIPLPSSIGGDSGAIEDRFLLNPNMAITADLSPVLPSNASPLSETNVESFGLTSASITYNQSRFGGSLRAPVAFIDVVGEIYSPFFFLGNPGSHSRDEQVNHYQFGDPPLYYDPRIRGDIVSFVRSQDWWELPSAEEPQGQQLFYIDQFDRVTIADGRPLADYYIQQFIPLAVSYTAGLFKAAAKAFDDLPPTITINDNYGHPIGADGTTTATAIYVDATDPISVEKPVPSGIYRVWLIQTGGGTFSSTNTFTGSPDGTIGPHSVQLPLIAGLTGGRYIVKACDGLGNCSHVDFSVNSATPPRLRRIAYGDQFFYQDFSGNSNEAPTAVQLANMPTGTFAIESGSEQGLKSLEISAVSSLSVWDAITGSPLNPANLAGVHSATGTFVASAGIHTMKLTDNATGDGGQALQTVAPFNLAVLSASPNIASSLSTFDSATGRFSGAVAMSVESSLGVASADYYSAIQGRTIQLSNHQTIAYQYPPPDNDDLSQSLFSPSGVFSPRIRDNEGNFTQYTLQLYRAGGLGPAMLDKGGFGPKELIAQGGVFDAQTLDITKTPTPDCADCLNSGPLLPGAVLIAGAYDKADSTYSIPTVYGGISGGVWIDTTTAITCTQDYDPAQPLARMQLSANNVPLFDGNMMSSGTFDHVPDLQFLNITNTIALRLTVTPYAQAQGMCAECLTYKESGGCQTGYRRRVHAIGPDLALAGIKYLFSPGAVGKTQFEPGIYDPVYAGDPKQISNFNVVKSGALSYMVVSQASEPGWRSISRGSFRITASPGDFFSAPVNFSVPYDTTTLTTAQISNIRAVHTDPQNNTSVLIPYSVERSSASFYINSFGQFIVEAPVYAAPVVALAGGMSLMSANPSVALSTQDAAAPQLELALAQLRAAGKLPVGGVYAASPAGTAFSTAAAAKLSYTDQEAAAAGVPPSSLALYQFSADGSMQRLPGQVLNTQAKYATGWVSTLQPYFAVLGSTTAVPFVDATPPRTQLAFEGWSSTDTMGNVLAATSTLLGFAAVDLSSGPYPVTGVARTYFLLDRVFVDMNSTPPQTFGAPILLDPGTHLLTFFSEDLAGNREAPNRLTLIVTAGQPSPMGAAALGADGKLWALEVHPSSTTISRYGTGGTRDFSVALPGTLVVAPWLIGFDPVGNAYAVQTGRQSTKVYEISPQGMIISTASYSGIEGQAASASSDGANLWLGGVATGAAALWSAGAAGLRETLFSDATGQSVLADGAGLVWFAGAGGELALWRFDSTAGAANLFDWPNYYGETGSSAQALRKDPSGTLWLGGWARSQAGTVAALWNWSGASPQLVATSTGTFGEQALGLDLDPSGNIWVTGISRTDSNGTAKRALWQYPGTGSALNLAALFDGPVQVPGYNEGNSIAVANGQLGVLTARNDGSFQVMSRALGAGGLSGTINYAAGFSGGIVFLSASTSPAFANPMTGICT